MNRTLLKRWLAALTVAQSANKASARTRIAEIQQGWRSLLSPFAEIADDSSLMTLTEEQWARVLSTSEYQTLRDEVTEPPGSSGLLYEDRPGVYVCAACDLPLFSSDMKYVSGTGWPSFFTSIPGGLDTQTDVYLFDTRIEYHCARCQGHQGHLFNDGPEPTHERWCNNGVALRFIPADYDSTKERVEIG